MKIKDRYWLSNTAIIIGILSILSVTDILLIELGIYGNWGKGSHFFPVHPGLGYGLIIILSALIYKAAKKRKFHSSKVWFGVEIVGVLLFILQFKPYTSGGYVGSSPSRFVEHLNWPFLNIWNEAIDPQIIPEYHVPAIIAIVVWVWAIAAYAFIKTRKIKMVSKN